LIENHFRLSDQVGQVQTKILIVFLISRKTSSINRKFGKHNFLKKKSYFMQKLLKALNFMN